MDNPQNQSEPQPEPRKVGRPKKKRNYKRVRDLQTVKAILTSTSLKDAYKKLHNCTDDSAEKNGYRMITEDVLQELEKVLQIQSSAVTTRKNLEKILLSVVALWTAKKEQTSNMLRALELLSKLVPDFKERTVNENVPTDETEIDKKLRELGIDPNNLNLGGRN